MMRKITLMTCVVCSVLAGLATGAMAQELSPDASATTADAAPTRSLEIAPLSLLLPALRVTYEQQLQPTFSFAVAGTLGTQVWSSFFPPLIAGVGLPLNAGVHGQLRKYVVGSFAQGLYLGVEEILGVSRYDGVVYDASTDTFEFRRVTDLTASTLVYVGAKQVRPSGLTFDVSLGGGVAIGPDQPVQLLISPRFDLGWSF